MTDASGPEVTRWKPVRAGIRNVWEYDDQVFAFADGRLILRGPNGSGKSNALALLFPFLLDGTMSAAAMDPFAGGRSMRSLLLGVVKDDDARSGRFRHDQRLGYVWLELARTDAEGTHHVTVGCGARATAQRDATSWFFVTSRRVGVDLDLAPGNEPLPRGRLVEVLGPDAVADTAEDHRAAVDRALFGFGPDRHRKLVGLIRVLRRPQLAGRLDPELLSTVLSEGLAALSPAVLDDVAASLDDLEATQRELEELRVTRAVVDAFVPVYQRYLVNEAAERVGAALAAAERRGRARRDRRDAQDDVEASEAALAANTEARRQAEQAARAADAERMAVIESPAYRDAASLREVTEAAVTAEASERGARRRRDQARAAADAARGDADAAATAATDAGAAASRSLTAVLDAADRADAPWTLSLDEAADPDRLESGARVVERARRDDLREVRRALEAREAAARDHAQAERAASAALAAADAATDEARAAGEAREAARERLRQATVAWADAAPGLDAAGRGELVEAVARVGAVGEPDLAVRYRTLVAAEREALVTAATRSEDRGRALADQIQVLEDERERTASEVDPGPEPPAWRRAERAGRPGAPLWACCDFAADLDPQDAAGIEAASGRPPACSTPGWHRRTAGRRRADTTRCCSTPGYPAIGLTRAAWRAIAPSPGAATLAEVLVPLPPDGSGLAPERVVEVLAGIGLGALGVAVDRDGRFTLGPLRGRAGQDAPQFIGATARAERRRRRLAEIDSERAERARLVAAEEAEAARLARARAALDEAEEQAPSTIEVGEATAAAAAAEARARSEAGVAARAAAAEAEAAATLGGLSDRLRAVATERRLEPTAEALDEVGELLGLLSRSVARAVGDRRLALERQARADGEHGRAEGAAAVLAEREEEWRAASAEAAGRRSRADTLQQQVGAEARAAEARLARAEQALEASRVEGRRLEAGRDELSEAHGRAQRSVEAAEEDLASAEAALVGAGHHLDVLRRQDLLAVLVPAPQVAAAAAEGEGATGTSADDPRMRPCAPRAPSNLWHPRSRSPRRTSRRGCRTPWGGAGPTRRSWPGPARPSTRPGSGCSTTSTTPTTRPWPATTRSRSWRSPPRAGRSPWPGWPRSWRPPRSGWSSTSPRATGRCSSGTCSTRCPTSCAACWAMPPSSSTASTGPWPGPAPPVG